MSELCQSFEVHVENLHVFENFSKLNDQNLMPAILELKTLTIRELLHSKEHATQTKISMSSKKSMFTFQKFALQKHRCF